MVVVAITITALAVRAADDWSTHSWLAAVGSSAGSCGDHEVMLVLACKQVCLDQYEASANENCPLQAVASGPDNDTNLAVSGCAATTKPAAMPLRFASYSQASQYCAQAGKRLPTPKEWHQAVEPLSEQQGCNVTARPPQIRPAGANGCATAANVYDLVGNVWEWVDAEVVQGSYQGRTVPASGYITLIDTSGVVVETHPTSSSPTFDTAYAWVREASVGGIVKGGFYGSGNDAGRYAQQVGLPLDTQTAGIGFRCIRDLI